MKNVVAMAGLLMFSVAASANSSGDNCVFPVDGIPGNSIVLAAGAYGGKDTAYQIDDSGHQATKMDVLVNKSNEPVLLLLGAYEPTIWSIGKSEDTNIAGVVVSGYHQQKILGLDQDVPVVNASRGNGCSYFYVGNDEIDNVKAASQRYFGRDLSEMHLAKNGLVQIGEKLSESEIVTNKEKTIESLIDTTAPLAGELGIKDALEKGLIRDFSYHEVEKFNAEIISGQRKTDGVKIYGGDSASIVPGFMRYVSSGYLVLKPFQIPAGLYGANAVTFFVPKGVQAPTGNPGHSTIIDLEQKKCLSGPMCGM